MANLISTLKLFPGYFEAAKAALAVFISAFPIYLGLRYFLYRRQLQFPLRLHIPFFGVSRYSRAWRLFSPLPCHPMRFRAHQRLFIFHLHHRRISGGSLLDVSSSNTTSFASGGSMCRRRYGRLST